MRTPALLIAGFAFLAMPALAQDFFAAPVKMGVYECYDQMANPTPTMMFGLIDDNTYVNYDGDQGDFDYDPATGMIRIGLETGAPARFIRVAENAFRAINEDGTLAGFVCPLNPAKDAANPPW